MFIAILLSDVQLYDVFIAMLLSDVQLYDVFIAMLLSVPAGPGQVRAVNGASHGG